MEDDIFVTFYVQINYYTKFDADGYEFFLLNFVGNRNPPTTPCHKGATEDDDFTVRYHSNISYS